MSSKAAVGGGYSALVKKSKNAGPKNVNNTNNQPKTKTAKVMSLKDTNEKHPAPHKAAKEEKKQEQPKKAVEKEEKRDLTKRDLKNERSATDRHVPRSGRADHSKTPKNEQVAEALDAEKTDEKTDKYEEKRRQEEAEAAAEKKRKEEEELRQMTYADYEKAMKEKKEGLGFKVNARKVDAKGFAKMTEMGAKKDDNSEFFKLEKKQETQPAKPVAKKSGKEAKAAAKPAAKKGKFVKSADVQLGFFSKAERPARTGGYKGGKGNRDNNRGDAAPAPTPAPAAEAKPEETTEEAPQAEEAAEGSW